MSTRRAIRIVVLFSIASVSATGVTFFSTLELTKPLFQTPTAPLSPVSATETQSAQFPPQTRAAIAIPDFATIFSYFGVAEPQPSPLVAPVAISNKPAAPPRPSHSPVPLASVASSGAEPDKKADPEASCWQKLLTSGVYLLPTDQCVDIDELLKKLETGIYRFNKPESAYVEEPFVATFSGLWGLGLSLVTMIIAVLGIIHYLPPTKGKQSAANHAANLLQLN
ncbi:MAG TPA: hypothetical protein VN754_00405 [Candidatus Binataceae bacterium]|jgi:hypothetical protein|nr:hypothetical protein [Candidatus Binataceae bacterium]